MAPGKRRYERKISPSRCSSGNSERAGAEGNSRAAAVVWREVFVQLNKNLARGVSTDLMAHFVHDCSPAIHLPCCIISAFRSKVSGHRDGMRDPGVGGYCLSIIVGLINGLGIVGCDGVHTTHLFPQKGWVSVSVDVAYGRKQLLRCRSKLLLLHSRLRSVLDGGKGYASSPVTLMVMTQKNASKMNAQPSLLPRPSCTVLQEPAKAQSAPKKAVGGLAGWDWGFKSTSKKPAAAPAKAEPVAVMKAEVISRLADAVSLVFSVSMTSF